MVRKCRETVAEIAVMEVEVAQVGVRTRTRTRAGAEAMAAATATLAKKRKLNSEDVKLSSSCTQLRNRKIPLENSGAEKASESRCSSPSLVDHDRFSTSCCSSNGSSERIKFVDLEDESVEVETSTYYSCRERTETTPSSELETAESDDLDSAKPSSEANSRRRSTAEKMPTESEIEEFFSEAEKKILKGFTEKYNFDFVKEEAMEGRYEWVRLKP